MPKILNKTGVNIRPKFNKFPFHGIVAVNNEIMGIKKLIKKIMPER